MLRRHVLPLLGSTSVLCTHLQSGTSSGYKYFSLSSAPLTSTWEFLCNIVVNPTSSAWGDAVVSVETTGCTDYSDPRGAAGVWAMKTLRSQYHLHQFASPSWAICKPLITFGHSLSSVFPCSKDQLSIANKLREIILPLYSASVRLGWVHFQNRRPPEVPSNPNYSMITKVLLYLTPCGACSR